MSRKKHRRRNKPHAAAVRDIEQPVIDSPEPQPGVTRYKAVVRSPLGEWWHDNKKRLRLIGLVGGGLLLVGYLVFELFRLIF